MKKILTFSIVLSLCISCLAFNSSALTVNTTYSDVTSTSTQAVNLVNFAMSYDDFISSDYVVFCDAQYSYYIVWGDLSYNGTSVSGSDVQYLRYYRSGSGTSYSYTYDYGTDSDFKLTPSHMCTSNIRNFGFSSSTYQEYKHYYDYNCFIVFVCSILFVILIQQLRRGGSHV